MAEGDGSIAATNRRKRYLIAQAVLCVLCTLIGAFYPTLLDISKTATEHTAYTSSGSRTVQIRERSAYPFSPASVVLINDGIQLIIALCAVSWKEGLPALVADRSLILKMLPLGVIYAIGELLTLRSVQKGSGPVYVVIANMKLVVAAVMSRLFFGSSRSLPWLHWLELVLISVAAVAYTMVEAGSLGVNWQWEGAWSALAKSSLVAFSSVFCEHTYKSNPFLVVLTLQALWGLVTMCCLIGGSLAGVGGLETFGLELRDEDGAFSILSGGPRQLLCSSSAYAACLQQLHIGKIASCVCISARGWDSYTLLTVVADLSNAISSALVFRRLSAVAKYICRASSAVPMYIFYCSIGRSSWDLRCFFLVVLLCVQVGIYTYQRHRAEAQLSNAAWPQHYKKP